MPRDNICMYISHGCFMSVVVASFQQHYLTFILQTYAHPEQRLRSWSTQNTSPSHLHTHKHECIQEIHTTIPTYSFCQEKNRNNLTLNPDKQLALYSLKTLQNISATYKAVMRPALDMPHPWSPLILDQH